MSEEKKSLDAAFDFATKDQVIEIAKDVDRRLAELQEALNFNAMLIDLHQYILAKFVPAGKLAEAAAEFRSKRNAEEINAQTEASKTN